jgi:hypothetical protein
MSPAVPTVARPTRVGRHCCSARAAVASARRRRCRPARWLPLHPERERERERELREVCGESRAEGVGEGWRYGIEWERGSLG